MTSVLGAMVIEDPCVRCGSRRIWLLRYSSPGYDRFLCVCEKCSDAVVVEPKRSLLGKAAGRIQPWMLERTV